MHGCTAEGGDKLARSWNLFQKRQGPCGCVRVRLSTNDVDRSEGRVLYLSERRSWMFDAWHQGYESDSAKSILSFESIRGRATVRFMFPKWTPSLHRVACYIYV